MQLETVKAFEGSVLLTDSGEPKHTVYVTISEIHTNKNPLGILVIQCQPKMVGTFEVDILDAINISRRSSEGVKDSSTEVD